jgi:hypothetical protein
MGRVGGGYGGEPSSTVVHGSQYSVQCTPLTRQSTIHSATLLSGERGTLTATPTFQFISRQSEAED